MRNLGFQKIDLFKKKGVTATPQRGHRCEPPRGQISLSKPVARGLSRRRGGACRAPCPALAYVMGRQPGWFPEPGMLSKKGSLSV